MYTCTPPTTLDNCVKHNKQYQYQYLQLNKVLHRIPLPTTNTSVLLLILTNNMTLGYWEQQSSAKSTKKENNQLWECWKLEVEVHQLNTSNIVLGIKHVRLFGYTADVPICDEDWSLAQSRDKLKTWITIFHMVNITKYQQWKLKNNGMVGSPTNPTNAGTRNGF